MPAVEKNSASNLFSKVFKCYSEKSRYSKNHVLLAMKWQVIISSTVDVNTVYKSEILGNFNSTSFFYSFTNCLISIIFVRNKEFEWCEYVALHFSLFTKFLAYSFSSPNVF